MSEVTSSQNVNSSNNVTGGDDYTAGPYDVTFAAGETSVSFDVPIIDDNILEEDEMFTLIIVPTSLPADVTRQGNVRTTVTIVDNEG